MKEYCSVHKNERLFDLLETSPFGLSNKSGVYAVCVSAYKEYNKEKPKERILYIGSSKNMRKRVCDDMSHPYRICLNRFDNLLVYTKSIETNDYKDLEQRLINIYKPLLNKNHKNAKKIYSY